MVVERHCKDCGESSNDRKFQVIHGTKGDYYNAICNHCKYARYVGYTVRQVKLPKPVELPPRVRISLEIYNYFKRIKGEQNASANISR